MHELFRISLSFSRARYYGFGGSCETKIDGFEVVSTLTKCDYPRHPIMPMRRLGLAGPRNTMVALESPPIMAMETQAFNSPVSKGISMGGNPVKKIRVRNFMPETWLFTDLTTNQIETTVPDTITSWKATAFCVGENAPLLGDVTHLSFFFFPCRYNSCSSKLPNGYQEVSSLVECDSRFMPYYDYDGDYMYDGAPMEVMAMDDGGSNAEIADYSYSAEEDDFSSNTSTFSMNKEVSKPKTGPKKIRVRNFMPETWMFQDFTSQNLANVVVPDTITSWSAQVFCLSSEVPLLAGSNFFLTIR